MTTVRRIFTAQTRTTASEDLMMVIEFLDGPNTDNLALGIENEDNSAIIILTREQSLALARAIADKYGYCVLSRN